MDLDGKDQVDALFLRSHVARRKLGAVGNVRDLTVKGPIGKAIHCHPHALPHAYLADLGFWILWKLPLEGFWTFVLTLPGIALLGLNHHSVMGGAVAGVLLAAVLFCPLRYLVKRYRDVVVARLSNSKFFKFLMRLWLVRALRWIFIGATR